MQRHFLAALTCIALWSSCFICTGFAQPKAHSPILLRNGTICDGTGSVPIKGDLLIVGDRVESIGKVSVPSDATIIDVYGLVVAPGFINMLSWATESLIYDGRSQSDIRQGVTLEVMGEGESMGPLNDVMKEEMLKGEGDIKFDIKWTSLGEYLDYIAQKGISPNVASFVGATTIRVHEIGYADRPPTTEELTRMQDLVRQGMREGALGVASALIYAPGFYAKTPELITLAQAAGEFGGMYISHIRSEGTRLLEAADELIEIAREARVPAEIYHIKAAGKSNWNKMDALLNKIEQARSNGIRITADMYTYTAAATGLDAAMPPWVQEGGYKDWAKRLQDPEIRKKVKDEMDTPTDKWENFYLAAGSPSGILLVGFKNDKLKKFTGMTLEAVAKLRKKSPEETAMDLVVEDGSRVGVVYFLMSEENVRKLLKTPWISFDSDAASLASEGVFLKANPHPRAYGNFARLLGKYVRDEKLLSVQEAVHRLSGLPAQNLGIKERGLLRPGYFADVAVFDPAKISDHATFAKPHQYATGMVHVFVNGEQVLKNGEHTGAKPGRVVRGRGWNSK